MYKYKISSLGRTVEHCDPYGFGMELRPNNASYIVDLSEYSFTDEKWMKSRTRGYNAPISIYEMHLGSWHTNPDDENGWYTYAEIADDLIKYVKQNHYTHIEFMPLAEHPADCSWGYQNTGFFSPTSRYGTAKELKELIDKCHNAGIGVLLDFVAVHFAVDDYGLNTYDGTCLYEYPDSDVSNSEWGTRNFIHSRGEVQSFLQSCANYWLSEYHFDGIRMDAISRAIYWLGDSNRGVNDRAVEFLKRMNTGLHEIHPTVMLMAEDSSAFMKVTADTKYGGLGFDYKWDLGWMNDTLDYFKKTPSERKEYYYKLMFSMHYFYSELFILPLSHDEVVHGKATIMQKMWGDYEDKFKQGRAFYMYMYSHPGKKLNFMGNEIGQLREWDEKREQDWDMLKYPMHDSFHKYFKRLNEIYSKYPALHKNEYHSNNFRWIVSDDPQNCIYAYEVGCTEEETILAVFNFSDVSCEKYVINVLRPSKLTEVLNSDHDIYSGGSESKLRRISTKLTKDGNNVINIDIPAFSGRMFLRKNK